MDRGEHQRSKARTVVMIVCHYDDTNVTGGLEKQAALLSSRIASRGKRVVVLASTRSMRRARWDRVRGVPTRYFWTYASPQVSGRYLPAALLWALQLAAWIFVHRREIEVIHCHQLRIHSFVAALARRLFNIPVVQKSGVGGPGADIRVIGSRKYFGPAGQRFVINNSDLFVATTDSIRHDLVELCVDGEKISVIPNGLSLPAASAAELRDDEVRVVFLGRISNDKCILELAQAAVAVCAPGQISLNIYGDGPQVGRLVDLLKEAGNPSVNYRGWVENVSAVLESHHYLILPSMAEGLSNAMLEAMAFGVVPVATEVSGCVDHIIEGETGFFLPGTDRESLTIALQRLRSVDAEAWAQMSGRCRRLAHDQFDIERVTDRYLDAYSRLGERRVA